MSFMEPILRNVYRGPSLDRLQCGAPEFIWLGDVVAFLHVTHSEIETGVGNEGEFVAVLSARLDSALDEMLGMMHAQTFPVHDAPYEPEP